jgi:hypothetical protein
MQLVAQRIALRRREVRGELLVREQQTRVPRPQGRERVRRRAYGGRSRDEQGGEKAHGARNRMMPHGDAAVARKTGCEGCKL